MRLSTSELAEIVGGELVGPDVIVTGAEFDSRQCRVGDLFLALVAERDGHDFAAAAAAGGAVAMLGQHDPVSSGLTLVRVRDTEHALRRWARHARAQLADRGVPVVGVTGSVGKTSTKDLIAAAVGAGRRVHVNPGSFNNELGVPLTLVRTPADAEVVVCEMGARGIGHIRDLAELVQPTIGVVTAVAEAHSSEFGSIEAIEQAKGELVEALPTHGTAVLNGDDTRVARMAGRTEATTVTVSADGADDAALRATGIELDDDLRAHFALHHDGVTRSVRLGVAGRHMVANALLALAVARAIGVDLDAAADALAGGALSRWRMEVVRRGDGLLVINDAYNANPTSMRAALDTLVRADAVRRVAVVGVMGELGPEGPGEHRAIAAESTAQDIEVIAVAAPAYGEAARHVDDVDEALDLLTGLGAGDAVLVKASRSAGLERLAEQLLGGSSLPA